MGDVWECIYGEENLKQKGTKAETKDLNPWGYKVEHGPSFYLKLPRSPCSVWNRFILGTQKMGLSQEENIMTRYLRGIYMHTGIQYTCTYTHNIYIYMYTCILYVHRHIIYINHGCHDFFPQDGNSSVVAEATNGIDGHGSHVLDVQWMHWTLGPKAASGHDRKGEAIWEIWKALHWWEVNGKNDG